MDMTFTDNICQEIDKEDCGVQGIVCDESVIPNGVEFSCANGTCQVVKCEEGYCITDNACEKIDEKSCAFQEIACDETVIEHGELFSCETGTCNDNQNCGEHDVHCDNSQHLNAAELNCDDGVCKVTQCQSGFHLYDNDCEENSVLNCGAHEHKCAEASHSSVRCSDSGTCVYECSQGYGDCDRKESNGCEVNFKDYGMIDCYSCDSKRKFHKCGNYKKTEMPLCVTLGVIHSEEANCKDYCNNTNKRGGSYATIGDNYYYVTVCNPGQKCYINNYSDAYVKCQ